MPAFTKSLIIIIMLSSSPHQAATSTVVIPGISTLNAIVAAVNGEKLVLADGTFTDTTTHTQFEGASIAAVSKSLTIRAQNAGKAILDGQNARRAFRVSGSATVVLEGIVCINGRSDTEEGGAIYVADSATVTIRSFTFTSNVATLDGGAIAILHSASATISGSTFDGNTGAGGGAVYANTAGLMSISDSTFTGNSAVSGGALRIGSESSSNGAALLGECHVALPRGTATRLQSALSCSLHSLVRIPSPPLLPPAARNTFADNTLSGGSSFGGCDVYLLDATTSGSELAGNTFLSRTAACASGIMLQLDRPLPIRCELGEWMTPAPLIMPPTQMSGCHFRCVP